MVHALKSPVFPNRRVPESLSGTCTVSVWLPVAYAIVRESCEKNGEDALMFSTDTLSARSLKSMPPRSANGLTASANFEYRFSSTALPAISSRALRRLPRYFSASSSARSMYT